MAAAEIRPVEEATINPALRLIVALAAVHAARPAPIRLLRLEDVDLPNRRITIAGHTQRLGELTRRALRAWLDQRRTAWPHTPNPHVLISGKTALGVQPVSKGYFTSTSTSAVAACASHRIRKDRILHEALTTGADPLHLALVFNLSHTAASRYATIAEHLLDGQLEQTTEQ